MGDHWRMSVRRAQHFSAESVQRRYGTPAAPISCVEPISRGAVSRDDRVAVRLYETIREQRKDDEHERMCVPSSVIDRERLNGVCAKGDSSTDT